MCEKSDSGIIGEESYGIERLLENEFIHYDLDDKLQQRLVITLLLTNSWRSDPIWLLQKITAARKRDTYSFYESRWFEIEAGGQQATTDGSYQDNTEEGETHKRGRYDDYSC
ncbi:hypothetical protein [Hubei virga-like virus 9]|uniref:hypothetical protein n=1 Tax=Hubei virga-like virus 9 TaxID=1923342 RepID=UPI00090AF998|nr:hypothetical protein [Hubei virga-like virus 9]APG77699.1 hypothetical protein [Hubei virga-like virus 9]